jgi:2-aminoadipate transaminase
VLDATVLLPRAVQAGVAFVPGAPFFAYPDAASGAAHSLRLSFVTAPPASITEGVATLGRVLHQALQEQAA